MERPKAPVKASLKAGRDILFDIDWQGARQWSRTSGNISSHLPPSALDGGTGTPTKGAGTDSEEVIAHRMRRAADEIDHWAEYDYVLVNNDMEECLDRVRPIVTAERSKRVRQTDLNPFVRDLIGPDH
jgi:guanylate kinase